jgi:hypothetical protein
MCHGEDVWTALLAIMCDVCVITSEFRDHALGGNLCVAHQIMMRLLCK